MKKNPSRKELRKEKRLQKKQRKVEYFMNKKTFKDKKKEDRQPGKFVRIQKEETGEHVANRKKPAITKDHERQSQDLLKENEKEKQKLKTLQKEMRKQRIKALNQENKWEDKTIKQLEKKLKLNKRKSKTIPRAFVDCGLDYILDVCDSENIQAAVNIEKNLQDSDSEYEKDLAYIIGKENEKKTKSKTFNTQDKNLQQTLPNYFSDNSEESEEEGEEQLLSNSEEENISAEEMSESDFQENSDVYQDGTDEDNENTKNVDTSIVKNSNKVLKNNNNNKKKSLLMENSKNVSSISKHISNKSKNGKNVSLALEESNENPMNKESKNPKRKRKVSISENMIEEKKIRNESDSEYGSNASELEEENEEEEEEQEEFWEDIYGRTRDKLGNIIEEFKGKYVPPHLRTKSGTDDSKKREQLEKIKKQLKGLLNRLAENNMHSISNQIDEMYMRQSRYDMNETMLNLYLESLITFAPTPERLIMEHAMLIAILQANVGTEIGAFFLQNLGKKFDELHSQRQEIENKKLDNLLLLLCHLYTFKIYHCELVYDILCRLCDSFTPKDIDLILVIFRSVGFTLRKDDPLALKQLIVRVQILANEASDMKDDARVRFMLDVLLGIKNNNMSKLPGYDPTHAEHLKKIIKAMFRKGNYVTELKISLEDLLKADERGRWWIVGSAWTGPAPHSSEKDETMTEALPAFSQEVLDLAKKQRMNTSNRKTIFCILMTAEDYLDAFEKLLKLGLKGQPEQEIVHVLIHCLLNENTYNPYYALVAEQLCMSDRRHQMTIQFSVWDRFKELTSLQKYQITNLAKFLAHLFLQKSLPISVLKVVEFVELDKSGVRLIRQVLISILLHKDKDSMIEVFNRIAKPTKLASLRQSLALFLHHFILRNKSMNENATPEEKLLQENVGQVIKVLNCFYELS